MDLTDEHPGFLRMFTPGKPTVGLFLPLWPYTGYMTRMVGQGDAIQLADRSGFAAIWVRDVPLLDPGFGDVGQVFDPWTYLTWLAAHTSNAALAAHTSNAALAAGSVVFTLRHPIDLAKQAASIDQLSGGRLVLGAASGDRPAEFPAYGIDFPTRGERYRQAVEMFLTVLESELPTVASPLGRLSGWRRRTAETGQWPCSVVGDGFLAAEPGVDRGTRRWLVDVPRGHGRRGRATGPGRKRGRVAKTHSEWPVQAGGHQCVD